MIYSIYLMDVSNPYKILGSSAKTIKKLKNQEKEEGILKNITHLYQRMIMYLSVFLGVLEMKKLRKDC